MDDEVKIEGDIDINQALKEFETKSQAEQIQKVPAVQKKSETPKMVEMVMKWFKIEQKQAEYILLGFVVIAIAFSIFLFINATRLPSPPPLDQIIKVAGPQKEGN